MKQRFNILYSFPFLVGLFLLVINDHWLKYQFSNDLTGKLSDFAGLFIFPLFISAILKKKSAGIFIITATGFIWWKLPVSQNFIDLWNSFEVFRISRIIDTTDLIALIVLPVSHWYLNNFKKAKILFHPLPVILLSSIAFFATSKARHIDVYRKYKFYYSKEELVERLNIIAKKDKQLPVSLHSENANEFIVNSTDTSWFYAKNYKEFNDTFFTQKGKIDTIIHYKIPVYDTVYISNNLLHYTLDVKKYFGSETKNKAKIDCSSVVAKIQITGDEGGSEILLMGFDTRNCSGIFEDKEVLKEVRSVQEKVEKELNKKSNR